MGVKRRKEWQVGAKPFHPLKKVVYVEENKGGGDVRREWHQGEGRNGLRGGKQGSGQPAKGGGEEKRIGLTYIEGIREGKRKKKQSEERKIIRRGDLVIRQEGKEIEPNLCWEGGKSLRARETIPKPVRRKRLRRKKGGQRERANCRNKGKRGKLRWEKKKSDVAKGWVEMKRPKTGGVSQAEKKGPP